MLPFEEARISGVNEELDAVFVEDELLLFMILRDPCEEACDCATSNVLMTLSSPFVSETSW